MYAPQALHLTTCWMEKRLERGALGLPVSQPRSEKKRATYAELST